MIYGYGIVDKDGKPCFEDCCVYDDPNQLERQLERLNSMVWDETSPSYKEAPYSVVELTFRVKNGKFV